MITGWVPYYISTCSSSLYNQTGLESAAGAIYRKETVTCLIAKLEGKGSYQKNNLFFESSEKNIRGNNETAKVSRRAKSISAHYQTAEL